MCAARARTRATISAFDLQGNGRFPRTERQLPFLRNENPAPSVGFVAQEKTARESGGLLVGLGGLEPLTFTMSIR